MRAPARWIYAAVKAHVKDKMCNDSVLQGFLPYNLLIFLTLKIFKHKVDANYSAPSNPWNVMHRPASNKQTATAPVWNIIRGCEF